MRKNKSPVVQQSDVSSSQKVLYKSSDEISNDINCENEMTVFNISSNVTGKLKKIIQ